MDCAKSIINELAHRTPLSGEVRVEESRVYCSPLEPYQPSDESRAVDDAKFEETLGGLRTIMRETEQRPMFDEVLRVFGYPSRAKLVPRRRVTGQETGDEGVLPTIMVVVDTRDASPGQEPIGALRSAFEATRCFLVEKRMTGCALEFVVREAVARSIDTEREDRWINEGSYVPQQVRDS